MRGGEKCLEIFCDLFPDATIMTLLHLKGTVSPKIEQMDIRTTFIQKMPWLHRRYRHYLPLFPIAIEQFDMCGYDLILSSSHCVAKGVIPHPATLHICYCHTPMRYVWSMYQEYFGPQRVKGLKGKFIAISCHYLRMWDILSNQRVHHFIANSNHVKKRIEHYYHRKADVIFPPVDTAGTELSTRDEGYYLVVSALVPYKRIDLAVRAFNQLNEKLIVIGQGSEEKSLKKIAGKNIEFLGWLGEDELKRYYAECRALIFPGEEDFGIVPVEVQAFGKPVIAYGKGGLLETVKGKWMRQDEPSNEEEFTGLFFEQQTVDDLIRAVNAFDNLKFDPSKIRAHALAFDKEIFKEKIRSSVQSKLEDFHTSPQKRGNTP